MAATLIFPERARWYAPLEWYQRLAQALPSGILVNAGGEVVNRDPLEIGRLVASGGIWVDYCGYPMYYRLDKYDYPEPGTTYLVPQGTLGFSRFLTAMDMLFDHTFMAEGFEYPRSLVVREAQVPAFVIPNLKAPHTEKTFSCFALKHPSGGMYFYAYAHPSGEGVRPETYASFVNSLMRQEIPPVPVPVPVPLASTMLIALVAAFGATALVAYALSQR